MARVSELVPLAAPYLPTCPDAVIADALMASAAEFCSRTHIWRAESATITTAADQETYELTADGIIDAVQWVRMDNSALRHLVGTSVPETERDNTGRPAWYWVEQENLLRLHPIPDDAYVGVAGVVLKPSITDDEVPEFLLETWGEALINGAVWRLAQVPSKAWSSAPFSQFQREQFLKAVARAKVRDTQYVPLRAKMRAF